MNQPTVFSWRDLHELFSVVMCIDESMTIVYASDTLAKCLPETLQAPLLSDVFDLLRPASLASFSDGVKYIGSLCLLTAKDGEFAIRGQLLQIDYQGRNVLCFCGSPWLFWINTYAPHTQLGLGDFSAQDVQLDQLFFMSTEKKMVEDLEKLNSDLHRAKLQLEEAQNAQKQFFAQMSHEIRTPLNGVVSALSLLEQLELGPEQSRFLQLANSSSQNLMQVINYVLSISKLELSEDQELVAFSCTDLIRSTIDVVRAKAQQKSLPLRLEFSAELPGACYGSADRLRQTLLNLLINAIKFTNEGEIVVRVKVLELNDEDCVLRLEVADTGLGIAEDDLAKVFKPFWSSMSEQLVEQEPGTGLGLDIVRRNVRSMGGEVHVESQPGQGATFSFELPFKLPAEPIAGSPVEAAVGEPLIPELAGHVLLVDDNDTNRLLGKLILESLGLDVTAVSGGLESVAAVKERPFDLVLMDINMPDIDGLEATRRIRSFIPAKQLPIVALTAFVDDKEKAACLEAGMVDYLTKPIVREELAEVLATWLASGRTQAPDTVDDGDSRDSPEGETAKTSLVESAVLHELVSQIGRANVDLVMGKVKVEARQRWQQLEDAESAGDIDAVRLHVHSLGSIFRSVGLVVIGDSLGDIESGLRIGEIPDPGWLQDILQLRVDSLAALDDELAAL